MNESIQLIMLFFSLGERMAGIRLMCVLCFPNTRQKTEDMNIKHAPGTEPHHNNIRKMPTATASNTVRAKIARNFFFFFHNYNPYNLCKANSFKSLNEYCIECIYECKSGVASGSTSQHHMNGNCYLRAVRSKDFYSQNEMLYIISCCVISYLPSSIE